MLGQVQSSWTEVSSQNQETNQSIQSAVEVFHISLACLYQHFILDVMRSLQFTHILTEFRDKDCQILWLVGCLQHLQHFGANGIVLQGDPESLDMANPPSLPWDLWLSDRDCRNWQFCKLQIIWLRIHQYTLVQYCGFKYLTCILYTCVIILTVGRPLRSPTLAWVKRS